MIAHIVALLLTLSPTPESELSPPPTVAAPPAVSSVSLLEQQTLTLERRVARSARLLPVWAPLVGGVGGGALSAGLAYLALTSIGPATLLTVFQILGGMVLVVATPIFVVGGLIAAIVFAVKNEGRLEQLAAAQQDLARAREELSKARQAEQPQSLLTPAAGLQRVPASLTIAEF